MTGSCCGAGALSKLAIGPHGGTITRMDFIDFDGKDIVKVLSDGGERAIRGTLDHIDTDATEGMLYVQFRTKMYLTSAKMAFLLPALGFTAGSSSSSSSGTQTPFTLGDTIPYSTVIVGPAGTDEYTLDNCVPTDWVISGQKGVDPITIDIGWMGQTLTHAAAGTFFVSQTSPAMTEGYVYPYAQGANNTTSMTFGSPYSATAHFFQFKLAMNYKVVREFNNSVTATNLCPTDHDLKLGTGLLFSSCDSTEQYFDTPITSATSAQSATVTLDFERIVGSSNYKTSIAIAAAKLVPRFPAIIRNDLNRLPVLAQCYATASTAMLIITNE